jgi:hypothetical protein
MSKSQDWEQLATLPRAAIRQRWEQVHHAPAPRVEASLLARELAWRMQADLHGGLDQRIERHLNRLCEADEQALQQPKPLPDVPSAGTRFLREWGGKVHHVELLPNGRYAYERLALNGVAEHAKACPPLLLALMLPLGFTHCADDCAAIGNLFGIGRGKVGHD